MNILLVPSCEIYPVDYLAGTRTLARLEEAMKQWRTGKYDLMILSGGFTTPKSIQTKAHAEIMKAWVEHQPDAPEDNRIIVEPRAVDTYQNIAFSLKALQDRLLHMLGSGTLTLAIVTEPHQGKRFMASLAHKPNIRAKVIPVKWQLSLTETVLEKFLLAMHHLDPEGIWMFARFNRYYRKRSASRL